MPDKTLTVKKILIVIPPTQYHDEEFLETRKTLTDDGATIIVASTAVRTCRGMNGAAVQSDVAIADVKIEEYDALVLCGGSSVPEFFWKDKKLIEITGQAAAAGKVVAAISLSTVVLAKAKLLAGQKATVYFLPRAIDELKEAGATYVQKTLLVSNNLIMAEGPPQAAEFAAAIRAKLSS